MTKTILLDHETPTVELMNVLDRVIDQLHERIGTAALVGTLYGTATLLVIESNEEMHGG